MSFLNSQFLSFFRSSVFRRNLRSLRSYFLFLTVVVVAYSALFHVIMLAEGQRHSWLTGVYWTLVTMSTLGYGDIHFTGDLGKVFSVVVLLSGVVFLLIVLPFTFIQLVYVPFLEAQTSARAPRQLPVGTHGHVILSHYNAVTISLIERLRYHGYQYIVLEPELTRALTMHDDGIRVMVGDYDSIETYERARAAEAALVVASSDNDFLNTNIVFTTHEFSRAIPIAAIARAPESVDILELAGASKVIELSEMLGRALARRAMGGDVRANVIGRFGDLLIAEAPVMGTPWVGKKIAESRLRDATGLTVVGLWERGEFDLPTPEMRMMPTSILVLAGSEEQFQYFTDLTAIYNVQEVPVLILGGGRVGRAVAAALADREIPYLIVEKDEKRVTDPVNSIVGSAADFETLKRAGIADTPSVIITTNDDHTNIYLTIYCRRLRPDVQIVSRATLERNVSTLHRAGADFVMSYASMGANAIFNVLNQDDLVMLAEGLDVFRLAVPESLVDVPLMESRIRESTGCSVVAIEREGEQIINPSAAEVLHAGAELILIGTPEGERRFLERFGMGNPAPMEGVADFGDRAAAGDAKRAADEEPPSAP